jgi:DNA adenine methylase
MIRPFLKWPGGKYRLVNRIHNLLPKGKQLIEPFVGGGAVFLNTAFEQYLLNDANRDLISLYQTLQEEGRHFIEVCRSFFIKKYNTEKHYYKFRAQFNASRDSALRSALFLYLNRHGYNGLCRYNMGKGEFNVPFGSYIKPYFPEKEMFHFYEVAKRAVFVCEDFTKTLKRAKKGSVIYCDPPYVPLTATANFTRYQSQGFSLEEQRVLATSAQKCAKKGIPVLLSNHSNDFTRDIYAEARIEEFDVRRLISCKPAFRQPVLELLALYA